MKIVMQAATYERLSKHANDGLGFFENPVFLKGDMVQIEVPQTTLDRLLSLSHNNNIDDAINRAIDAMETKLTVH